MFVNMKKDTKHATQFSWRHSQVNAGDKERECLKPERSHLRPDLQVIPQARVEAN